MTIWTVFEPEDDAAQETRWAERVVFVREAFSWLGLFFAPIVLLAHRLWLALAAYVAIQVLLAIAIRRFELEGWFEIVPLLPNLFVALELSGLRRWKLSAKGYEETGVVTAPSREEAERRFFAGRAGGTGGSIGAPGEVLGLFPGVAR